MISNEVISCSYWHESPKNLESWSALPPLWGYDVVDGGILVDSLADHPRLVRHSPPCSLCSLLPHGVGCYDSGYDYGTDHGGDVGPHHRPDYHFPVPAGIKRFFFSKFASAEVISLYI